VKIITKATVTNTDGLTSSQLLGILTLASDSSGGVLLLYEDTPIKSANLIVDTDSDASYLELRSVVQN
jgi:hypothetical protein